ncbi:hypothetical protein Hanom_Chr05g00408811 [Helianthus anomalus]
MENPTEISPFHHLYTTNLIEEHSRACNLCGRYLLQFSTFSGDSKSQLAYFFCALQNTSINFSDRRVIYPDLIFVKIRVLHA